MRSRFGILAGAAVLSLLATPALAYVRTLTNLGKPSYWKSPCVTIVAHVGNLPGGLTAAFVTGAAEGASGVWGRPTNTCTDLQIRVLSTEGPPPRAIDDRSNHLILTNTGWERALSDPTVEGYDGNALALTTIWAHPDTGIIEDADIEINTVDFAWADLVALGSDEPKTADLQNSLAHEFGHFVGLDHNCTLKGDPTIRLDQNGDEAPACTSATEEEKAATMFAEVGLTDVERRTLDPDDINGVCAIYPSTGAGLCTFDSGSGGCVVASPSTLSDNVTGLGFCALAIAVGAGRLRVRRRRG